MQDLTRIHIPTEGQTSSQGPQVCQQHVESTASGHDGPGGHTTTIGAEHYPAQQHQTLAWGQQQWWQSPHGPIPQQQWQLLWQAQPMYEKGFAMK